MTHDLKNYIGRSAVFIESSQACLATVESVDCTAERITAAFRLVPGTFMCRLRLFRTQGDGPIDKILDEAPFDNTWDILVSNKEFFLEEDHWQASFLWGGGFRIFFQPSFVSKFLGGDVGWLHEYYGDGTVADEETDG